MRFSDIKNSLLLLASAALLHACSGDPLEEAAQAACDCVKPIYAEIAEVKKQVEQAGPGAEAPQGGLNSADQAEQCLADVQKRHPDVEAQALEQRLLALMKAKQCGNL